MRTIATVLLVAITPSIADNRSIDSIYYNPNFQNADSILILFEEKVCSIKESVDVLCRTIFDSALSQPETCPLIRPSCARFTINLGRLSIRSRILTTKKQIHKLEEQLIANLYQYKDLLGHDMRIDHSSTVTHGCTESVARIVEFRKDSTKSYEINRYYSSFSTSDTYQYINVRFWDQLSKEHGGPSEDELSCKFEGF